MDRYHQTELIFTGDAEQGAHRLRLIGEGSADAWSSAISALRQRAQESRYWGAWQPSVLMEVVATEIESAGVVIYMAGSIAEWRALVSANVGVPAIDAAIRALGNAGGSIDRVVCESRRLDVADYARIAGADSWPWPVHARSAEVTHVRPLGTIGRCTLQTLATMLAAAVHSVSDQYDRPVATVDDDRVCLAEPIPAQSALQLVHVWSQVCWAELVSVALDQDA